MASVTKGGKTATPNAGSCEMQMHFQMSKQQMKDYTYLKELHSGKKLI